MKIIFLIVLFLIGALTGFFSHKLFGDSTLKSFYAIQLHLQEDSRPIFLDSIYMTGTSAKSVVASVEFAGPNAIESCLCKVKKEIRSELACQMPEGVVK